MLWVEEGSRVFSLAEELLLLALHEEKGTVLWVAHNRLSYCLAGALLMELILKNRLRLEPKVLEVVNRTPTGDPMLDGILRQINLADKTKSPQYWITKIGRRIKPIKNDLLKALVDKGILNSEEHRVMGIFPTVRYPSRDDRPKRELRSKLRSLILRGEQPDLRLTMLICLVYTCALTNTIFDKDERKDARKKVKEIAKPLPITQAITKAIQGAQAAAAAGG